MKRIISLIGITVCIAFTAPIRASAASPAFDLTKRMAGKILLQVQSHGEAYYVHPDTLNRYYMADGDAAYRMMRYFGLGITEANYALLEKGSLTLRRQLAGKIVLRVGAHGEAYYIKPQDLSVLYLKNGEEAYQIMRKHSLGITTADLEKIPEALLVTREDVLPLIPSSSSTLSRTEAESHYWKGFDIWVKTKDYESAEKEYVQALQHDPDFAPALSSYGFIRASFHNEFVEGEKFLHRAMIMDPKWGYAPYNLGLLYDLEGMHYYLDLGEWTREQWIATAHPLGIQWVQFAIDKFPTHPDRAYFQQTLRVMQAE